MDEGYIVSPFRRPRTPVITGAAVAQLRCVVCDNVDQTKFLTVTSLAGDTLHGFVCAICEARNKPKDQS